MHTTRSGGTKAEVIQGKGKNKICGDYVGVACVDGSCPIANADTYAEYGMDAIRRCEDCFMRKGCEDCALYDTDLCPSSSEDKEN